MNCPLLSRTITSVVMMSNARRMTVGCCGCCCCGGGVARGAAGVCAESAPPAARNAAARDTFSVRFEPIACMTLLYRELANLGGVVAVVLLVRLLPDRLLRVGSGLSGRERTGT